MFAEILVYLPDYLLIPNWIDQFIDRNIIPKDMEEVNKEVVETKQLNFLEEIIEADLASGKH